MKKDVLEKVQQRRMSTTTRFRKHDVRGKAEKTVVVKEVLKERYLQGDRTIFEKYLCQSLRIYFRSHKNKIKYNYKR